MNRPFNNYGLGMQPPQFQCRPQNQWHTNYHTKNIFKLHRNGNNDFWCETCDRGFPTKHLLEEHIKTHQKCNIDGCQFIAHPKVITKHIQMQHSSGLYKKIANLNNPDEIKKWREERKRKYPTKENVDKKNAERKEKIDRGEKMCLNQSPRMRNSHIFNKNNTKSNTGADRNVNRRNSFRKDTEAAQNHKRTYPSQNVQKSTKIKKPCNSIPVMEEKRKLKPFTGIQNIIDDEIDPSSEQPESCNLIEDDEYVADSIETENISKDPVVCGALSSLMCNYESSDEEKADNNDNCVQNNIQNNINSINSDDKCVHNNLNDKSVKSNVDKPPKLENTENKCDLNDNDSGPEEVQTIKIKDSDHTMPPNSDNQNNSEKTKKSKLGMKNKCITKQPNKMLRHRIPTTLLEKLLSKEIRQERNIILQCIRHITRNNYFNECKNLS